MSADLEKIARVLVTSEIKFILIQLKRAAGRPKDLEPIAELQALLEEKRKQ